MESKNLTTTETNHAFFWTVNMLSKSYYFKTLTGDQLRKEIDDTFKEILKFFKSKIDWHNLTALDCENLGFGILTCQEDVDEDKEFEKQLYLSHQISKEEYEKRCAELDLTAQLRLIPRYLYEIIPEGLELISVLGKKVIVGKDVIDNDTRCGCLAYGIIPKK